MTVMSALTSSPTEDRESIAEDRRYSRLTKQLEDGSNLDLEVQDQVEDRGNIRAATSEQVGDWAGGGEHAEGSGCEDDGGGAREHG